MQIIILSALIVAEVCTKDYWSVVKRGPLVVVRVAITVMKNHDQKQVGEEQVYLAYCRLTFLRTYFI